MTKRFLPVAAVAVAALAVTSLAFGATKHKLSDPMALRLLSGAGSQTIVFTGTIHDKALGNGAIVVRSKPAGTPGAVKIVATAFFKAGTATIKGTDVATPRADGSGIDYSGSAKAVSGTGRLKGVSGAVRYTGSSTSADPTYQTYKVTGTLKY